MVKGLFWWENNILVGKNLVVYFGDFMNSGGKDFGGKLFFSSENPVSDFFR